MKLLTAWMFWITLRAQAVNYAHLPGYRQKGHCIQFAEAAVKAHEAEGTLAFYVEMEFRDHGKLKAHAVCIFGQPNHWSIVDNELGAPFRARGRTMLSICRTVIQDAHKVRGNGFPLPNGNQ